MDELVGRHDRLLKHLHHLNDLGVVLQLRVKVRTVLVEHLHQLRLGRKVLYQLLKRPYLQFVHIEVGRFADVVGRVELLVDLLHFLLDLLAGPVDLHLLEDAADFVGLEHLPTVGIGLQKQHHSFRSKRIGLADSIEEHDALDDEVLQALPDQHLLLGGAHGNHVTVQRHRLQNEEILCFSTLPY